MLQVALLFLLFLWEDYFSKIRAHGELKQGEQKSKNHNYQVDLQEFEVVVGEDAIGLVVLLVVTGHKKLLYLYTLLAKKAGGDKYEDNTGNGEQDVGDDCSLLRDAH